MLFPQQIDLSNGEWEIGLCEVNFIKKNEKSPNMYICCEIIRPSFINNKTISALLLVPEMRGENYKNFDCVYYFDIVEKYLDKVWIYITMCEGETTSFNNETLHCTLHIREKLNKQI